jgi:hypothetical protein
MRKDCEEMIARTLRSTEDGMRFVYQKGILEGVKIVKNLIEIDNIEDMGLLKKALDIFVENSDKKDNRILESDDVVDVMLGDVLNGNIKIDTKEE